MTTPAFDTCLANTLRWSRYAAHLLHATPQLADELRASHLSEITVQDMQAQLGVIEPGNESRLKALLRLLRRRVVLHTMLRDFNGLAGLDEVVRVTTALAEVSIRCALDFHMQALCALHGTPSGSASASPQALLVVGMGKLGGGELNVSSDIDLVFMYDEDGETNGTQRLSNQEFFTRAGRKLIAALDDVTADGFVFRVDMRLRPFGDAGPLAVSSEGLEHYFITSAQPWERYAWLKARAITGDAGLLQALTRPFVYRRYHDYGMLQDLRELHAKIRAEAMRKNKLRDIKVGAGGIREIEFIAQLFQLIRGGRETALQTCSTRDALQRIGERGLTGAHTTAQLQDAYAFLRNLEHRLQYLDDAQTQALPAAGADRDLIAATMGFAGVDTFMEALDRHRAIVSREFDALFAAPGLGEGESGAAAPHEWSPQWLDGDETSEALLAWLNRLGFADAQTIVARLREWRQSSRYRFLTEKGRAKLERLIPLALLASSSHGSATFVRVLELLEAIDRRDAYLSLLIENPGVLESVARLAAQSAWAAGLIQRHPILLDELLRKRSTAHSTDWERERAGLEDELLAAGDDVEHQYELLRHFKQVHTLRLNIADVDGAIALMALADELCALADLLLDVALALAWRHLHPGEKGRLTPPPGFAVIGYGKLGSKELGYASDLDLVFLFDPALAPPGENYIRLAQRFNQWLNAATAGGVLYETDLRLRPDGESGVLVPSMAAFSDYELKRAWTWEHQALTRARFCAGDRRLEAQFAALRDAVLATPHDPARLREEVLAMRSRISAGHPDPQNALDLKHAPGGIVDLEFIVQYLVLANAHRHRELARNTGNHALLILAGELGLIKKDSAQAAAQAYLAFRARQHLARNNNESRTLVAEPELLSEREAVRKLWNEVFAG
jgi:glutamate-ammonia-ligase adenylyltransferase